LGELEAYRIGQVIEHRAVRVEVVFLVQQADIFLGPAPLLDAGFGHVYPFLADLNVDLPARGLDEAGDDPRQCGFPCPALSDDAEDLLCVHIERDAVDGLDHAPVDRDIALDQIPRPDDLLARLRVFEGFGVVAAFHELTYHVPGRSDLCDCAIDQQDSTAGHIFDHLREVGRYHHTHVVGLCRFGEHQVDDLCGSGIQRAGRFIGKKQEGLFCQLPGKHHALFLAAREVTGDMHHPVGEPDLVDKVGCTVDGLLLRVIDVIECMKDILDYAVVSVEGKGPLEHDRGPPHHPPLQRLVRLVPEIHIECRKYGAAMRAGLPGRAGNVHVVAGGTG